MEVEEFGFFLKNARKQSWKSALLRQNGGRAITALFLAHRHQLFPELKTLRGVPGGSFRLRKLRDHRTSQLQRSHSASGPVMMMT